MNQKNLMLWSAHEVWGGNRESHSHGNDAEPGRMGSLCSHQRGRSRRRPSLYVRLRSRPDLARGTGRCERPWHDVNAVTQALRILMRQNINAWDQSDFMRGINNTFRQDGNR